MSRRNFWATTGAATLIAAVIAAGATLLAKSGSAPDTQVVTVTQTPPPGTGPVQPPASETSAASSPGVATGLFWKGSFDFDNLVDFDQAPPRNQVGGLGQDSTGTLQVSDDASVWTSPTPPTEAQCANQIATRAADSISLGVGTQVCYETVDNRIVYLKVTATLPSTYTNPRFRMDVVVWNAPSAGS